MAYVAEALEVMWVEDQSRDLRLRVERVTGVEPALSAWGIDSAGSQALGDRVKVLVRRLQAYTEMNREGWSNAHMARLGYPSSRSNLGL